jgi:hypothetical protein
MDVQDVSLSVPSNMDVQYGRIPFHERKKGLK